MQIGKGQGILKNLQKNCSCSIIIGLINKIVSQHEGPTVMEIENEIKHMKNSLIDQIMFNTYLNISDQCSHDAYKIIVQNNFDKQLLNFARKNFFKSILR